MSGQTTGTKARSFLNDLKSLAKSKVFIIIVVFSKSIIIARALGPSSNGIISSLEVYPSLFMVIGSLGIRQSATYFIGKEIYSLEAIKKSMAHIWLFTSIVSLLSCFFLIRYLSSNGHNMIFVLLAIAPIPFTLLNTYTSGILLGQNRIQAFNQIEWVPKLIMVLVTILLIVIFSYGIQGVLFASLLGAIIVSCIILYKENLIASFNFKFEFVIIKRMLSLGIVYAIALLVINLNYKFDIILLDSLSTNYEIGIYSKGANLMQYLWEVPGLFGTLIFARSSIAKNSHKFSSKLTRLLRVSLIAITIGSVFLYILAPHIIILLFGNAFAGSAEITRILLPGVILMTIFKVLNGDLAGKGKPWVAIYALLPSLIINVVFNYILIPVHGAAGAAIASTISYSIGGLLFLHFYSKTVDIPIRQILNFSKKDFSVLTFTKQ